MTNWHVALMNSANKWAHRGQPAAGDWALLYRRSRLTRTPHRYPAWHNSTRYKLQIEGIMTAIAKSQPSYARLALILGALAAFGPLSIDMYLPALPTIAADFGTTTAAVQQTLSVFFVGLALGQLFYGPISDRVGRHAPLLFGCAMYALVSLLCMFAPSVAWLMGLRFLQALGSAAGVVIGRSVVRDLFDERESARMYSFLVLVMGIAPIAAPLIGGQLLIAFGWRAIFLVLAGFGLLCLALVWFGLDESLPAERRTRDGLGQHAACLRRAAGRWSLHGLCAGRRPGISSDVRLYLWFGLCLHRAQRRPA